MSDDLARPLPYRDVHALFDVVVVFLGELMAGEMPPDTVKRVIRRMTSDGFLRPGASAGELGATIDDLVQRLHYAMGVGDAMPEPTSRKMTHSLVAPTRPAAWACRGELMELGGSGVVVRGTEAGEWEVLASFPELPPDPSFHDRMGQLENLATRHGGRYLGSQR